MPGFLLHVGALVQCSHAAPVSAISSNTRVLVNGLPVVTISDTFLVAGCPFIVALVPQPCVRVQWLVPASRVLVNGQPALLQTSTGLCLGPTQAPQGAPIVSVVQTRVTGT
jgi:hypothetical protein